MSFLSVLCYICVNRCRPARKRLLVPRRRLLKKARRKLLNGVCSSGDLPFSVTLVRLLPLLLRPLTRRPKCTCYLVSIRVILIIALQPRLSSSRRRLCARVVRLFFPSLVRPLTDLAIRVATAKPAVAAKPSTKPDGQRGAAAGTVKPRPKPRTKQAPKTPVYVPSGSEG